MVSTKIAAVAYDGNSVTVFLVWHAACVEPACQQCRTRFCKTYYYGQVLSNCREPIQCVGTCIRFVFCILGAPYRLQRFYDHRPSS